MVSSYSNNNGTLEDALKLLQDENVISLSVVKQTPAQYLKSQRAINEK